MKYLIIPLILLLFVFFIYWGIYFPIDNNSSESVVFTVAKGESLGQIASNLQEQGLVRHRLFFVAFALHKEKSKELKAGDYEIAYSLNIPQILQKLSSGDRIKRTITIIEGWTVEDIQEYLQMGEIDSSLEGYLFPDTYEISKEDSLEDIVSMMRENFDRKVGEVDKDIVIMASILEKEVKTSEDKKVVAGILWKRLDNNMPLQVDATITYLTKRNSTHLTKEELDIDSPYNTYKYLGLPPAPISNPGLQSIEAALNPVDTKYWFYLSTPDGETIFSTTLKEHEQARQKYLN